MQGADLGVGLAQAQGQGLGDPREQLAAQLRVAGRGRVEALAR